MKHWMLFYKEATFEYYFFDGVHPIGVGVTRWLPEDYGELSRELTEQLNTVADPTRRTKLFTINGTRYRVDSKGTFKS